MRSRNGFLGAGLVATFLVAACNELNNFPPAAPGPVPPPPPSQFNIPGHWEALSDQGRRIAFDISSQGVLMNTRINVHHDCSAGRLRLTIDGLETQISGDTFTASQPYRINDAGNIYVGRVSLSGRFESDNFVRGGFVNTITDKPFNDIYGVCTPVSGSFDGYKDQ